MSKNDGTYVNFPLGLREQLDLVVLGTGRKRTRWVTELIEDEVAAILSALPYDVGQTLDNLYPKQNMMKHYKALIDRVHQRCSGVEPAPDIVPDDIAEEGEEEDIGLEIDVSVIDSITKLS